MTAGVRAGLSALDEVLLAAAELSPDGEEFSEWDLTVRAWQRNQNKFGCRGYEDAYPDHKRVMMEIMSSKASNPIKRGWIEQTRTNHYKMTRAGLATAYGLGDPKDKPASSAKAAANLYDAIEPYVSHPVFRAHRNDPNQPKTWLGAAAFLGLTAYDNAAVQAKLRAAKTSVSAAIDWLHDNGISDLRRGPAGGGAAISQDDLVSLQAFVIVLEERFERQFAAIRER